MPRADARRRIQSMIDALDLTPRQKTAALLYFGEERRILDVARIMGFKGRWKRDSVRRLLQRARERYPALRRRRYHRRDFDPFADL